MDWPGRDGDRLSYSPDASVLLMIPGIIVAVVFGVYGWALVDKALDPIEALRHSSRITRGHRGQVFAFALIAIVLNIVGVLLMIVGVLVTSAVTLIAAAKRALEKVAVGLLDDHLRGCVADAARDEDPRRAEVIIAEATAAIERLVRS